VSPSCQYGIFTPAKQHPASYSFCCSLHEELRLVCEAAGFDVCNGVRDVVSRIELVLRQVHPPVVPGKGDRHIRSVVPDGMLLAVDVLEDFRRHG
jgi:hypothetical protein